MYNTARKRINRDNCTELLNCRARVLVQASTVLKLLQLADGRMSKLLLRSNNIGYSAKAPSRSKQAIAFATAGFEQIDAPALIDA